MPFLGAKPTDVFADRDLNGQEFILDADADTSITADTDDQIDIRIAGADDFQFTANTFTAQSGSTIAAQALTATTFNASGVVGVISAHDLGVGLHIKSADSGLSAIDADADELIIEGSGNSGLSILSGSSSIGAILFAVSTDADRGSITYDQSDDTLKFEVGGMGTPTLTLDDGPVGGGVAFIRDSANTLMNVGLTMNQIGHDNEIFALKSTDIAHGMTDNTETDTFFFIKKSSGTAGAPDVVGLGEGTQGIRILGQCVTADTAKSTSAAAPIILRGVKKSSAGNAVMGSDENVLVIEGCAAGAGFIFDSEGSLHSNAANVVFDEYDDAQLVRTIDRSLSTRGLIASKFDEFVQYRHEDLAEAGLVGRDDDGSPNNYVNWMHLSKLHNGAIWQQHEKHENLLRAVYELASESLGKDKADKILEKNDIKLSVNDSLLN